MGFRQIAATAVQIEGYSQEYSPHKLDIEILIQQISNLRKKIFHH
tara:strand:+ start:1271 stop:1405 length:135 start_codon:yes stop_codon:yes gene_type:complete